MAMTGQNSANLVRKVISMEVDAFVEKSESYAIWKTAIQEVLAGRRYFSPATLERLMQNREIVHGTRHCSPVASFIKRHKGRLQGHAHAIYVRLFAGYRSFKQMQGSLQAGA